MSPPLLGCLVMKFPERTPQFDECTSSKLLSDENFTDYAAMGVKRLKVINQGPHADNNCPQTKLRNTCTWGHVTRFETPLRLRQITMGGGGELPVHDRVTSTLTAWFS
ncbi:hypothetical protein HKD37_16G045349 [Glycine soja]